MPDLDPAHVGAVEEPRPSLPIGLCGNREDHQPHRVDGTSLSPYWCSADQERRLPFAAEKRQPD